MTTKVTGSVLANTAVTPGTYNNALITVDGQGRITSANNGGLVLQSVQTANFTANVGGSYPVNTSNGAITITLPASPTAGQQVNVFDYAGISYANNIIINTNGGKINGSTTNATMSTIRSSVTLIYVDSIQGWCTLTIGNGSIARQPYAMSYLVVAGGGASAPNASGGGGGGGFVAGTISSVTPGTLYTAVVGAGGTQSSYTITNGTNSTLSQVGITAIGGGGAPSDVGVGVYSGNSGGSGGGGRGTGGAGGAGTSGQGYAGGAGSGTSSPFLGGGGGGAGAVGGSAGGSTAGSGGAGITSSITGSSVYYAGGGAGGAYGGTNGTGGVGGGGNLGVAGTVNTGGGAGSGAAGGSGIVILSLPTISYSGITTGNPTVTYSGSNTVISFTSSGTYTT